MGFSDISSADAEGMELLGEILSDLEAFTKNCRDAKQKQLAKQISDQLKLDLNASKQNLKRPNNQYQRKQRNSSNSSEKPRRSSFRSSSSKVSLGYEMYHVAV